jgi:predicted transcriptional regulator
MYKDSEFEIRKKIYSLINKNPGLHFRRIVKLLDISLQLADYHLLYLEKLDLISSVKEAGYKRYYINGDIGRDDRKRLSLLRQEIPLKIILLLLKEYSLTHKDILKYFDIAASTLSYHLKKLVISGLIYIEFENNEKRYKIHDKKVIIDLLIKYKPFSMIDNFSKVWKDFMWKY